MMDNRMTQQASFDEIIFENRHKEYGAYQLRLNYARNLSKGFWITLSFITLIFSLLWVFRSKGEVLVKKVVQIVSIDMDKLFEPQKPIIPIQEKQIPLVKTEKLVPPTIVDDKKLETYQVPTDETLKTAVIGSSTVEGIEPMGLIEPPVENIIPTIEVKNPEQLIEVPFDNTVKLTADIMPEYNGGMKELLKFLQKNIIYPNTAMRAGIEGKVFVQFVVSKNGQITDVEVIKGIGFGCDEEAKRVVDIMPNWRAGVQNGNNVNVRYTLPISFHLE